MPSLERVKEKIGRARHHIDQLRDALVEFYEKNPPILVPLESTPGHVKMQFQGPGDVPPLIPLIFGDALQNLRSALDYLIWELVLVEGKQSPDKQNMFPIALTVKGYKDDLIKRHRLDGVGTAAQAHIDVLQPHTLADPEFHPLAVLEALTNINKHRRILVVQMAGDTIKRPFSYPHVLAKITGFGSEDEVVLDTSLYFFAAIQDSAPCGSMEVTVALDTLANYIENEVLPLFEQFFK